MDDVQLTYVWTIHQERGACNVVLESGGLEHVKELKMAHKYLMITGTLTVQTAVMSGTVLALFGVHVLLLMTTQIDSDFWGHNVSDTAGIEAKIFAKTIVLTYPKDSRTVHCTVNIRHHRHHAHHFSSRGDSYWVDSL